MTATLTSKGQITLPVALRRRLGIHAGDRLTFVCSDGRCEVIPMHNSIRDLKGMLRKPARALSLAQIDEAIAGGALR